MAKDKARPGSLGARLLNFGRSRIQRYTADGDTPESTAYSETPPTPTPSVYSSAPPAQPAMPPPSELPPVTPPQVTPPQEIPLQETLPPEARPGRAVRRAPRETNAAPASPPPASPPPAPSPRPEQNAEDRPRQTIGRDLLFILQRHEELQTGQESDTPDSGESFSDASSGSPAAPPTQGRRLGRRPAPPAPESPPPGTPMPRRPRPTAEGSAPGSAPPASPAPPNVARTPAPQPAAEPSENWEITHFDDEDTAALYDGDTVRYAQPETPPSAVPRRTHGQSTAVGDSSPVQRKPAAQNRDPGGKSRKASPLDAPNPQTPTMPTTPRQTRAQINRTPEPPAENPPPRRAAPAPQQHDLPLIEDVEGYEAPLMSDSFELNAGFDLTHQPGTPAKIPAAPPAAPVQRDEIPPAPTPSAPSHSPVEHAFSEALPIVLPPTRRGRGFIEEFPTQQPNTYEEQPDYDLPYFDEETDRVTEQIDDDSDDNHYGYREQTAPDIPLMRYNAPPSPSPTFDDAPAQVDDFSAAPTLHRAADDHFDTSDSGLTENNADDGDQGGGDDENPYAQDFDGASEADFDSRPDLYEALLRAGMVHSTPPEAHNTPIYRAPDPVSKSAVMPSFEGVYDEEESAYDTDEDADTIYNYDDDDEESEPEMLPDAESGEEMPFGSVEASLHDLMRYADDESGDDSADESSDYHTAVSFDDDDSDLYDVAFDADADDDSGTNHDDPPAERTPGHMIRRFADAEADLLRLLDLPPGTSVSHGEDNEGDIYNEDDAGYTYGEGYESDSDDFEAYEYGDGDHISAESVPSTPHTNRPRRPAEPPHQPISLANALAAPASLPPQTYIAREVDSGEGDGTAESNNTTPAASAVSGETDENKNPSENPDVDKLARDVFRKLRSKLRIEQERRSD